MIGQLLVAQPIVTVVLGKATMIGQLLIAQPIVAVVLGKATVCHPGLEFAQSRQYEMDFA